MEYEVNEEKRNKFIEYAGKRVNNVMHDIQILEPMARSNSYDFTKQDVEEMFDAMQEALNDAREEFNRKFEGKAKSAKKVFTFGSGKSLENTTKSQEIENIESLDNEENSSVNTEENTEN